MYDVEVLNVDFGRESRVYITMKNAGQYYYAQQNADGDLIWIRQVHEEEVKPYITCKPEILALIVGAVKGSKLDSKGG